MQRFKGFPPRPQPKPVAQAPIPVAVQTPAGLPRPKAPQPPTPEQRAAWEIERKKRAEAEAARVANRACPPPRPMPPPRPGTPEYQAGLDRMAALRATEKPQPPAAAQPGPDPVGYVDEEETHDEDGRMIIRKPVQPGPRPPASVLTPAIEARALGPMPPRV